MHDVLGSDHRPVQLGLTIKDFKQPEFGDLDKLLDRLHPNQGIGQYDLEMVDVRKLNLARIGKIAKFDFNDMTQPIQLRVSFVDCALDTVSSPIIFS